MRSCRVNLPNRCHHLKDGIAPGQSAVFYRGDEVVVGGVIV